MRKFGKYLDNLRESRLYDKIDETDLSLRNVCSHSIVKLADREAVNFLKITLSEKFNEKKVGPVATEMEWFRGI